MGRTKYYAEMGENFPPRDRVGRARRAGVPSSAPFKSDGDLSMQDIVRVLTVRLQRLWVVLKYRWHYLYAVLFKSGLALKLGFIAALAYLVFYSSDDVVAPTENTNNLQEREVVVWETEAAEPPIAEKPGGREVLLPNALRTPAPTTPEARPTTAAPTTAGPKKAVDPSPAWLREGDDEKAKKYIERFANIAVQEMRKYGVPASIALAQGLIESRCGTSTLAVKNNNHFGIKCFSKSCRPGHCTNLEDDHHKDFFRKYNTAWESWRAHSILISTGRYARLKKYGKDYRAWARGLEELGYATDRNYSAKLIGVIERYNLHRFDHP